jgi:hypothetical protein
VPEKDKFLTVLLETVKELHFLIKNQYPRIQKMWELHWTALAVDLPAISTMEINSLSFTSDITYRIEVLRTLQFAMKDAYFLIKLIVDSIFQIYIGKSLISEDFSECDIVPASFLISERLIGSLLQFIMFDQSEIPMGYLVIAKNKAMMKIKPLSSKRIASVMEKSNFSTNEDEIHTIMKKMHDYEYVDLNIDDTSKEIAYKFNKDFELTPEGNLLYKKKILPVIEWTIGMWRSLYNIRSLDITIPKDYFHSEYLQESVSRAATQGFATAYNVIENIANYYSLMLKETLK